MIKPMFDRILVEQSNAETITEAGIYLPKDMKNSYVFGTVIDVGEGTKDNTPVIKKGDKVFFSKHASTPINYDGKDYLLLREADVFAVET